MPRMSKKHPMTCSLKKSDGFRVVQFTYIDGAYFVIDKIAKKKSGPFMTVADANGAGLELYADNGRRAGVSSGVNDDEAKELSTAA